MIVRERNITLEEKIFVKNLLDALRNNDISYFYNGLCRESQGFLQGAAIAKEVELINVLEACMQDIRNRCKCILDYHDEVHSIGMAKGCEFVKIQDILIFLVTENGELRFDYLRDWEDDYESNTNFH